MVFNNWSCHQMVPYKMFQIFLSNALNGCGAMLNYTFNFKNYCLVFRLLCGCFNFKALIGLLPV
jgi:hypothetical protein